jgi:AcrR family transcriptional regulator
MCAVTGSLAERKRQLVRDELTESALRLLAYQGYEQTTVEQIVAAAGVSRRTFFRYFRSKEDVIIEFLSQLGAKLRDALAARPASEPPMVALRRALSVFTDTYGEHGDKSLRLATITLTTPALLGRYLERQAQWRAEAADALAARMATGGPAGPAGSADGTGAAPRRGSPGVAPTGGGSGGAGSMGPALVAAVGFATFDVAIAEWVRAGGRRELSEVLEEAFDGLATLIRP